MTEHFFNAKMYMIAKISYIQRGSMSMSRQDRNFIEYIIILQNISQIYHTDIDCLTEEFIQTRMPADYDSEILLTACNAKNFIDEMPGGFFIYHADGNEEIIYANKAVLRIFGCSTLKEFRKLTGNSFKGMVHYEDLDSVEKSIKTQISMSHYDLDYVEYRIIRKDGEIRWLEDYGHFVHIESIGDIFYVFVGDATEKRMRYLAEKDALLSENSAKEKKLKSLIDAYDKELSLINKEHLQRLKVIEGLSINYESILYADLDANKILPYRLSFRTEQLFEQKSQMLDFNRFHSDYINTWVHPDDRKLVLNATSPDHIKQALAKHNTFYINYHVVNGSEIQCLQLRIVNVGSQEHISQIVMGYRNVDEEIRREMEQKQILERALDNANLSIIARNTFLSNMSHDMRTPLNGILGFLSLARIHMGDSDALPYYLDKIEASGKQLLNMINEVLEMSWNESDEINLIEEECELCSMMQDVRDMLLPQAKEKKIDLSLDYAALQHPVVYSDYSKLKQCLLYLANNAVKYTPAGGTVSITTLENEKSSGDYGVYQFIVKDNGIGISKDSLVRIFEPFEREKNTTLSGIHGTGLGLTIARSIVKAMGGKIDVSSEVGLGSTFTITLSLRIKHTVLSPQNVDSNVSSRQNRLKILLVEDNEINLEIETKLLEELGFTIDTAENGEIAVKKIETSSPKDYDLILMDIQMPVMDGREAARAIRKLANPDLSNIPIIALSADAFENDRRLSIESGMNAHLTKPLDIPQLLETIDRTMQGHMAD